MTYHLQISIEGVLLLSNYKLGKLFGGNGSHIRKELKDRLKKGELLIPSEGCEGFDPIKGCPGHPDKSEPINS